MAVKFVYVWWFQIFKAIAEITVSNSCDTCFLLQMGGERAVSWPSERSVLVLFKQDVYSCYSLCCITWSVVTACCPFLHTKKGRR